MTEPRTAAGRRVQRELEYLSLEPAESIVAKIVAIEDEAAEPAGLDVERLAKALRKTYPEHLRRSNDGQLRADAEFLIREYAALASPATSTLRVETSQGTGEETE